MDKYVFLVFLLAPGFVACSVGFFLSDFSDKRSDFGVAMRYFVYSFFIFPIALLICALTGIVPWNGVVNAKDYLTTGSLLALFFIVMLVSVLVGAIWPMFLRQKLLDLANKINIKRGVNEVFIKPRVLDDLFDDGKKHFLSVERDGKRIAMGFWGSASSPDNEKTELALYTDPSYDEWFDYAQKSKEDHPLKHCKTVYLSLEDNLVVREYEFPPEWEK